MKITQGASKYGRLGLSGVVEVGPDEELYFGVDSFEDAEQSRMSMVKINADPRINELFQEIQHVVELGNVIRWGAQDIG